MHSRCSRFRGKCRVLVEANSWVVDRLSADGVLWGGAGSAEICRLVMGVGAVACQGKLDAPAVHPLLAIVADGLLERAPDTASVRSMGTANPTPTATPIPIPIPGRRRDGGGAVAARGAAASGPTPSTAVTSPWCQPAQEAPHRNAARRVRSPARRCSLSTDGLPPGRGWEALEKGPATRRPDSPDSKLCTFCARQEWESGGNGVRPRGKNSLCGKEHHGP